jgi:hypothetical protein
MSNINPQNIDGTFPIAGQDNNSQGFRDNFTNTINNFTSAAAELTDLQTYAVLTGPLASVGQTGTPQNDMNYAYLTHAQMIGTVQTPNTITAPLAGGSFELDWSKGHFQTVSIPGNATMSLTATWPGTASNNLYTEVTLQVIVAVDGSTLTIPSSVTWTNLSDITGGDAGAYTITFPVAGTYQYKFSSVDGGASITIRDLINNYQTTIGNVNVFGNLITNGGRIEAGYQYYSPTGNLAFTANTNVSRIILDPSGAALVSLYANITLPTGNVDAKVVAISSTQTVQFLSVWPSLGTTLVNVGNISLAAGTQVQYFYHANEGKWYKIA